MSLASKISKKHKQKLWYRFSKALVDKRILFRGKLVDKYEVFHGLINDCENESEFIIQSSYMFSNGLKDFQVVWRWKLMGYKDFLQG